MVELQANQLPKRQDTDTTLRRPTEENTEAHRWDPAFRDPIFRKTLSGPTAAVQPARVQKGMPSALADNTVAQRLRTTIPPDPRLEQILGASEYTVRGAVGMQGECDDTAFSHCDKCVSSRRNRMTPYTRHRPNTKAAHRRKCRSSQLGTSLVRTHLLHKLKRSYRRSDQFQERELGRRARSTSPTPPNNSQRSVSTKHRNEFEH